MKFCHVFAFSLVAASAVSCSNNSSNLAGSSGTDYAIQYSKLPLDITDSQLATDSEDQAAVKNIENFAKLWKRQDIKFQSILDGLEVTEHGEMGLGYFGYPLLNKFGVGGNANYHEALSHMEDMAGFTEDGETKPTGDLFELKTSFMQAVIDQETPKSQKIKYSPEYSSFFSFLDKKIQSFSGTMWLDWVQHRSNSTAEFRKLNRVMILTPGHILPGYMIKNSLREWELHGVETTVAGKGHRYFGPANRLAGKIVVVDAELFRVVHSLRNYFKSDDALSVARDFAISQTAKRYKISLTKVDPSVFSTWKASLSDDFIQQSRILNHSPFFIAGDIDVPVNKDQELQEVDEFPPEQEAGNYTELTSSELTTYKNKTEELKVRQHQEVKEEVGAVEEASGVTADAGTLQVFRTARTQDWPDLLSEDNYYMWESGPTFLNIRKDMISETILYVNYLKEGELSREEKLLMEKVFSAIKENNLVQFKDALDNEFTMLYKNHSAQTPSEMTNFGFNKRLYTDEKANALEEDDKVHAETQHDSTLAEYLSKIIIMSGTRDMLKVFLEKRFELAADNELNKKIDPIFQKEFVEKNSRNILNYLYLRAMLTQQEEGIIDLMDETRRDLLLKKKTYQLSVGGITDFETNMDVIIGLQHIFQSSDKNKIPMPNFDLLSWDNGMTLGDEYTTQLQESWIAPLNKLMNKSKVEKPEKAEALTAANKNNS